MKQLNNTTYSLANRKIVYIYGNEPCDNVKLYHHIGQFAKNANIFSTIKLYILVDMNNLTIDTGDNFKSKYSSMLSFIKFIQSLQKCKKSVYDTYCQNLKIHIVWFNRNKYWFKRLKTKYNFYKNNDYCYDKLYIEKINIDNQELLLSIFKEYNISFEGCINNWWRIEDKYFTCRRKHVQFD